MPTLTIATPTNEDGSANQAVAANTVVVTGSGFAANAQIQATATANGVVRSATVSTDAQGGLNRTVAIIGAKAQQLLANLTGAAWSDGGTSWSCGLGKLNGDTLVLTIAVL